MKGYTLLEIMVGIVVFLIIGVILTDLFTSTVFNQKMILYLQELLDETSYLLEYMGRALRMAKKDDIGGVNCLLGDKVNYEIDPSGSSIKFRNSQNECQKFFLENNQIKQEKSGQILPLTSSKIKVNSLRFNVLGETQNDTFQPRVAILLEISIPIGKIQKKIQIQTMISQRDLDVKY